MTTWIMRCVVSHSLLDACFTIYGLHWGFWRFFSCLNWSQLKVVCWSADYYQQVRLHQGISSTQEPFSASTIRRTCFFLNYNVTINCNDNCWVFPAAVVDRWHRFYFSFCARPHTYCTNHTTKMQAPWRTLVCQSDEQNFHFLFLAIKNLTK